MTGKALQQQREALGITVGELARAMKVTPAAITQLETRAQPRPETVARYRAALKTLVESNVSAGDEPMTIQAAVGTMLVDMGRKLIAGVGADV